MTTTVETKFTPAPVPFNDKDADIILRSSDKPTPTDFRVHKLLLRLASPVFVTMLSLPQPDEPCREGLPVVEMAENARTLTILLGFCYPISVHLPPPLNNLEEVRMVLQAAAKYEMEGIKMHIKTILAETFSTEKPLEVFAIAHHHGWMILARWAARCFLAVPLSAGKIDELELISAATYRRLMDYRKRCRYLAVACINGIGQIIEKASNSPWGGASKQSNGCKVAACKGSRRWWIVWIANNAKVLDETPGSRALSATSAVDVSVCNQCNRAVGKLVEDYKETILKKVIDEVQAVWVPKLSTELKLTE